MNFSGTIDNEKGNVIVGFKTKAYEEYLAARCLFLNNCLEQGVSLSNGCIEKQIKAILAICNVKFKWTHDTPLLLDKLRTVLPVTGNRIRTDYLKRLFMIHELRYFDPPGKMIGLNYFVSRNFYLAELDFTFSLLDKSSTIEKLVDSGEKLDHEAKKRDPLFYSHNYIFQGISKLELFNGQDYIESNIILPKLEMYKCILKGPMNEFYNRFDGDGIIVNGNELKAITPP